jgi:hypothetical protein
MAVELKPLVLESSLTMQRILEAEDHTERLKLVRAFIEAEVKRLTTKRTLRGVFLSSDSEKSAAVAATGTIPPEEQIPDASTLPKMDDTSVSKPLSTFDEPDAFQ